MIAAFYSAESIRYDAVTVLPYQKFGLVAEDWHRRFDGIVEFPSFVPAIAEQIKTAHDPQFVDDMIAGRVRNPVSGYDPCGVAAALWEAGAVIAATRRTLATGMPSVAVAACFHHAGYRRAHAFCTFNGIVVAALEMKRSGYMDRIGILDLDAHFGDGTADIIDRLGLQKSIEHYSFAHRLLDRHEVDDWLDGLEGEIESMKSRGVGFLIYYAGCDPHIDDPMIKGVLTTQQMRRRESIVFQCCRRLGLPICWTLGGGYQRPLDKMVFLHGLAMEECVAAYGRGCVEA